MTTVGELALWTALLLAVWTAVVSFVGGAGGRSELIESGVRGTRAVLALSGVSATALWEALVTRDFSLAYVASVSASNLPMPYTISAFWAGRAGALLLASITVAACAVVATRRGSMPPRATAMISLVLAGLLLWMCVGANPFERLEWTSPDGRGLDPRLQSAATTVHRPLVFAGYAAAGTAFALVVARRPGRRWATVAWTLLTLAVILGMLAAYSDPSTNESWLPGRATHLSAFIWLAVTAWLYVATRNARARALEYAMYAAALIVITGLFASAFGRSYEITLRAGASTTVRDAFGRRWTFTNQGVSRFDVLNRQASAVTLDASGPRGRLLTTEIRQYVDGRGAPTFEPVARAAIARDLDQDVYVVVKRFEERGERVRIAFNPLVQLVWLGGVLLVVAGAAAFWPRGAPA